MECKHRMVRKIADAQGVSAYKTLEIPFFDCVGKKKKYASGRVKVLYEGDMIPFPQKHQIKGGEFVWKSNGIILSYVPHTAFITIQKSFKELGVEVYQRGTYRDSLGGGWYSDVFKYYIPGFGEYADIECSC